MIFDTPDRAIRFARDERARLGTVAAFDPIGTIAQTYQRVCGKCGAMPLRQRYTRDGLPFATCRHCGHERERTTVYELRAGGEGRRPDPSRRLISLADVELAIERAATVGGNDFLVFWYYVTQDRSREAILPELAALKLGPGLGGGFTKWTLRKAIDRGRRLLALELASSGLLDDPSPWLERKGAQPAR